MVRGIIPAEYDETCLAVEISWHVYYIFPEYWRSKLAMLPFLNMRNMAREFGNFPEPRLFSSMLIGHMNFETMTS